MYPLLDAARTGDLAKIKQLLKEQPSRINKKDEHGRCAWHHAAKSGWPGALETAVWLIRAGGLSIDVAAITLGSHSCFSPLHSGTSRRPDGWLSTVEPMQRWLDMKA
jgi:hypothetical protein